MNLRFDEAVEGVAERPSYPVHPVVRQEARDETRQSEPIVAQGAAPSDDLVDQRRHHRLEHAQRAGAVEGFVLLAAAEGEAAALGDIFAQNEEARAEARRGPIRVTQHLQGAVLRPVGVGNTGGVIGRPEHPALPFVPLAPGVRRRAA
jgi:hypothetical protein